MAIIDNLVASWELDEASGDAIDAHGANDLADNNTVGAAGGWRDFERDNDEFFVIADNTDLSFGDEALTIAAEVELESKPAGDMDVVGKGNGSNGEYFLQYSNAAAADRFVMNVFGTTGFGSQGVATANTFGSPPTGTPCFLVGWHDPTNNQLGIQVNDGTADTVSHSAGILDSGGEFYLSDSSGVFGNMWDGRIRRVRIWRRVLTAEEKTWLYNAGSGRSYSDIVAGMPSASMTDGKVIIAPVGFA